MKTKKTKRTRSEPSTRKEPRIGLALGSGGAKGISQVGVIQVLQEHNIPIHAIAGVSAGAIVGAYLAIHGSIDGFEDALHRISKHELLKLIDFSKPNRALFAGKKVERYLATLLGDHDFDNLTIPLWIVATDMLEGKEVWLKTGSVNQAIRASISLPGIFPPHAYNNTLYLDGGLINPTPVSTIKAMGADIVIAIDHTMRTATPISKPNLFTTLARSYEIIRTEMTKLKIGQDPYTILIRIQKNNLFDTYRFYKNEFIEEGIKEGQAHIEAIKQAIAAWQQRHTKTLRQRKKKLKNKNTS
ncbi:hypothetical protein D6783_00930 [Candidatus Woesearchaeota archaeon]|nr:MAG: hypothetical protein D6783_00930 [Candidatus Woesearchaeota archaeon]